MNPSSNQLVQLNSEKDFHVFFLERGAVVAVGLDVYVVRNDAPTSETSNASPYLPYSC